MAVIQNALARRRQILSRDLKNFSASAHDESRLQQHADMFDGRVVAATRDDAQFRDFARLAQTQFASIFQRATWLMAPASRSKSGNGVTTDTVEVAEGGAMPLSK